MKKKISAFFISAAVLLPILTGCGISEGAKSEYTSSCSAASDIPAEGSVSKSTMSSFSSTASSSSSRSSSSTSSSKPSSSSSSSSSRSSGQTSSYSKPEEPPVSSSELPLIDFNSAEFIEYPTAKPGINIGGTALYMYDFRNTMSSGIGYNDYTLPIEAHYGLTAYIDGTIVYVKAYNNTNDNITIKSSTLENLDVSNGKCISFDIEYTDYTRLDAKNFINGLFRFSAEFSSGKTVMIYFYANGGEVKLCRAESLLSSVFDQYRERRSDLNKFIADNDITPSGSSDVYEVYYPYPDLYNWHCDTQAWIDLSNTLVSESWSEERKLGTFVEWICNNISYDYYKYNVIKVPRPHYYNDFSGKYSTYSTHVGVCIDFSQILCVMCRAHGIPAIVTSTETHSWNLVYVNGRWTEIDLTPYIKYGVYYEDTNFKTTLTLPKENRTGKLFGVIPHSYIELSKELYFDKSCYMDQYSDIA